MVCGKDTRATESCCYSDAPKNTLPSKGISRLIGEWSAAYDTEPAFLLRAILSEIRRTKGDTANFQLPINHTHSQDRQMFLRHFVQAQMVVYEAPNAEEGVGLSRGWFFWTLKMEFAALGEWDFLRGYEEGWIPTLPSATESSESVFGTCREIAQKTQDDDGIVTEYPDPQTHPDFWSGPPADDDFVVSHAGSTTVKDNVNAAKFKATPTPTNTKTKTPTTPAKSNKEALKPQSHEPDNNKSISKNVATKEDDKDVKEIPHKGPSKNGARTWFPMFCVFFFAWGIWKVFLNDGNFVRNRRQYTNLDAATQLSV